MRKSTTSGGARPAFHGRVKAGFAKDGKLHALDLFVICDNGPYEAQGDGGISGLITSLLYQPPAMRFRSLDRPDQHAAARFAKSAGRHAGHHLDRADAGRRRPGSSASIRWRFAGSMRRKAKPLPARPDRAASGGMRRPARFIRQALDKGAELFNWDERKARAASASARRCAASASAMSTFFAGSSGFDGLLVIKPDGRSMCSRASATSAPSR